MPEVRVDEQCSGEREVQFKGWTKKKKRGPRLRFSSSKAQRRAKRKVLNDSSTQEGSDKVDVANLACFEKQPLCPVSNGVEGVDSRNRTSNEASDIRGGVTNSFISVDKGVVANVQKGARGQSLIGPTTLSESEIEQCSPKGQEDRESLHAVQCSIDDIHLRGVIERDDGEARRRSQVWTPTAISPRRLQAPEQVVSTEWKV